VRDFNVASEKDIGFYAGYIGKKELELLQCFQSAGVLCDHLNWLGLQEVAAI
jgi:hypothetical protein